MSEKGRQAITQSKIYLRCHKCDELNNTSPGKNPWGVELEILKSDCNLLGYVA